MSDNDTSLQGETAEEVPEIENDPTSVDFASGDVAWNSATSLNGVRHQIEAVLNKGSMTYGEDYGDYYRVDDLSSKEALICSAGDYWVAGYTISKGVVTVADESDWRQVDYKLVELSDEPQLGAEMHFADESEPVEVNEDGFVWKTILREGTWKMSPGAGQKPVPKPITVVANGKSDSKNLIISMEEIKNNFDTGAVQHVTIPTSHADTVLENTGFVKGLRFNTDDKGRKVLQAAHDFTEPDVREKALRGTIANTSAGILFDYVNKETGKTSSAVLGHVALTNHPWLNDMNPFGVLASENIKVLAFSEESEINEADEKSVGGEEMSSTEAETPKFLTDLGLSEDQVRAMVARYEELEARDKKHTIDEKVREWESENKAPALVSAAKTLLSAADSEVAVLNLSEDGKTVGLTAVDIIDRLMDAAPALTLAEDPLTEEDVAGEAPAATAEDENKTANLSQQEKVLANQLFLDEGYSRAEAQAEAVRRLRKSE